MLYLRDGTQYTVETQLAMRKTIMDAARSLWIYVNVGIQRGKIIYYHIRVVININKCLEQLIHLSVVAMNNMYTNTSIKRQA